MKQSLSYTVKRGVRGQHGVAGLRCCFFMLYLRTSAFPQDPEDPSGRGDSLQPAFLHPQTIQRNTDAAAVAARVKGMPSFMNVRNFTV